MLLIRWLLVLLVMWPAPLSVQAGEVIAGIKARAAGFTDWPPSTLPVFIAVMFGATLGGNATLIGASSNIVTAGICAMEGERLTFGRFMRYGLPITIAQLSVGAVYILVLFWLAH